jgi:preprotein translocase subunit SecE
MNKIIRFLQESYAELKKVTWPSRDDVSASTRIVIISTALIAMALGLVDFLIYQAIELIF